MNIINDNEIIDLVPQWGFCPYCLVIKNNAAVRVKYNTITDERLHLEIFYDPIDTVGLSQWIWKIWSNDNTHNVIFEINAYRYAFIPVAIINGTPVCEIHLWERTNK